MSLKYIKTNVILSSIWIFNFQRGKTVLTKTLKKIIWFKSAFCGPKRKPTFSWIFWFGLKSQKVVAIKTKAKNKNKNKKRKRKKSFHGRCLRWELGSFTNNNELFCSPFLPRYTTYLPLRVAFHSWNIRISICFFLIALENYFTFAESLLHLV